jgi:hypothetical protein
MYDPNQNTFDVTNAERMLGMKEEDILMLKLIVSVDLLCAYAGITDESVSHAYESRIKTHIQDALQNLRSVIDDE